MLDVSIHSINKSTAAEIKISISPAEIYEFLHLHLNQYLYLLLLYLYDQRSTLLFVSIINSPRLPLVLPWDHRVPRVPQVHLDHIPVVVRK